MTGAIFPDWRQPEWSDDRQPGEMGIATALALRSQVFSLGGMETAGYIWYQDQCPCSSKILKCVLDLPLPDLCSKCFYGLCQHGKKCRILLKDCATTDI
jgi:hypothetical protein